MVAVESWVDRDGRNGIRGDTGVRHSRRLGLFQPRTPGGPMPEAVIVATARSPIGRAFKGSLVSLRPDDMATQIVKAVLAKVPALDPATVEDLILGNAQPAGEAGYNMARVVALLAGMPTVPGT